MRKRRYAFICLLIIIIYAAYQNLIFEVIDREFLGLDQCPSCYGISCNRTNSKRLNLHFFSSLKLINKFFNVKNVFFASEGTTEFVLKRLAHTQELKEHDAKLCESVDLSRSCNASKAIRILVSKYGHNLASIIENNPKLFSNTEVLKCGHDRVVVSLYKAFRQTRDQDSLQHFLTLLAINPEPLIIQTFGEVLPVPRYFGACGRVVIEEFAGRPLSHYKEEPWPVRARLALQLLRIADAMTKSQIRIYLTDPSADNFAVDREGTVRIIDVENVVLVDSQQKGIANATHFNDGIGCSKCLSYDYEDLCNHSKSDHNFFAICKGLLSSNPFSYSLPQGLLHTIPEEVLGQAPQLPAYIEECADPKVSPNRLLPAASLSRLLEQLIHES